METYTETERDSKELQVNLVSKEFPVDQKDEDIPRGLKN